MSNPVRDRVDPKAWIQELRSNRRTQIALAALALVLGYLLWPESSKKPRPSIAGRTLATPLDERQFEALQKLKDLTKLDQAGELPDDARMYRDLFLFDMPPRPRHRPRSPSRRHRLRRPPPRNRSRRPSWPRLGRRPPTADPRPSTTSATWAGPPPDGSPPFSRARKSCPSV